MCVLYLISHYIRHWILSWSDSRMPHQSPFDIGSCPGVIQGCPINHLSTLGPVLKWFKDTPSTTFLHWVLSWSDSMMPHQPPFVILIMPWGYWRMPNQPPFVILIMPWGYSRMPHQPPFVILIMPWCYSRMPHQLPCAIWSCHEVIHGCPTNHLSPFDHGLMGHPWITSWHDQMAKSGWWGILE